MAQEKDTPRDTAERCDGSAQKVSEALNFNDRRPMHIITLIPARGNSKRIPNKNIKLLGGKPLVLWSIETALALRLPCYVSTESKEIGEVSHNAGAHIIWRPSEFCTDDATDDLVIRHALTQVEADLVVYLRPTTPIRDKEVVWYAVRVMQFNEEYTLLRSVHEMDESPFKCVIERKKNPWWRRFIFWRKWVDKPNHLCPRGLHPNGYVDICRGEWTYKKPYWFETERVVELDSMEQWEYAEWRIGKGKV